MPQINTEDLKIVKLELNDTAPVSRVEMQREVDGLERQITAKLLEKDKAIALLQDYADRQPSIAEVDAKVAFHKELFQTQLKERDVRVDQVKEDGEKAIAAALQAQKEAVGKTELGFTKELDAVKANNAAEIQGIKTNNAAEIQGLRREISDLKDSRNIMAGQKKGSVDTWGSIVVIATLVIAVAAVIVAVLIRH